MLLEKHIIEQVLDTALETGADFAEVYIEDHSSSVLQSVSGRLEKSQNNKAFGVGVRIARIFNRFMVIPTVKNQLI
jgi:TldD protein